MTRADTPAVKFYKVSKAEVRQGNCPLLASSQKTKPMSPNEIKHILDIATIVMVVFIVLAAMAARIYVNRAAKRRTLDINRRWIESLPSMISTLGVLGTFGGITLGLLFFDTNNLNVSIPLLLSGLKTAFFT